MKTSFQNTKTVCTLYMEVSLIWNICWKKKGEWDGCCLPLRITKVDGILMDIGVSSMHLDMASRGFSFKEENDGMEASILMLTFELPWI